MFPILMSCGQNWELYKNNQGLYVPQAVDQSCPFCKRSSVTFNTRTDAWEFRRDTAYIETRCPACKEEVRFWLAYSHHQSLDGFKAQARLYIWPEPPLGESFDSEIYKISPSFVEIYQQSHHAENVGLETLVGVGYRKALEFLIKDWLCAQHPDKAEDIKSSYLDPCIKKYVTDARILECATRTAWLGNDETHYIRKWADKDINDLKALLRLTVGWITNSLLTERYIRDMGAGKK